MEELVCYVIYLVSDPELRRVDASYMLIHFHGQGWSNPFLEKQTKLKYYK